MQHNWKAGVPTTQIASARRDLQNVLLDPCLKPPKSALGTARTAPNRFSHSRTRPRALLAPGLARGCATDNQRFRPPRSLQLLEIYKMSSWTFVSNLQKVHLAPPEPRQAGLVTPVHVHALCWRPVSRVGAPPTASSCQFVCLLSVRVPLVTIFFRVSDRVRVSSSFF